MISQIKKRILIIAPYFYPHVEWGGPILVSWNLAKLLRKEGYFVEVLTTDVSVDHLRIKKFSTTINGVKIIYAKSFAPGLSWKFRIFLSPDQIVKGIKLIREFDTVHFNDVFILQNFVLSIYCRKFKIPYIITPHGNLSFEKERSKSWAKRVFYFLFARAFFEGAAKIIAVSDAERKYISETFQIFHRKQYIFRTLY